MTFKKTVIAAVISLTAIVSGAAMAQNGGLMHSGPAVTNGQGMGHGGYHRGYGANLTQEQQTTVQKAYDDFQTKTADLRQKMMSKNYEYRALLTSNPVDDQKVQAVGKEISALRDSIYQHRVELDTQLAKAGIPMMGRGMGGGHKGMRGGHMGGGHMGMNGGMGMGDMPCGR
ncbi:periplasmic heavy metal sensor [Leminorella richardii]|nr:periplasmic heavy metal sensor [Leminorella richardii]